MSCRVHSRNGILNTGRKIMPASSPPLLLALIFVLCISRGSCIYLSRNIDLATVPFVDLFTFGLQHGGGIDLQLSINDMQYNNNTPIYFYICEHDKYTAVRLNKILFITFLLLL